MPYATYAIRHYYATRLLGLQHTSLAAAAVTLIRDPPFAHTIRSNDTLLAPNERFIVQSEDTPLRRHMTFADGRHAAITLKIARRMNQRAGSREEKVQRKKAEGAAKHEERARADITVRQHTIRHKMLSAGFDA